MNNPFSNIVPRKNEEVINTDFIKAAADKIKAHFKDKKLVVFEGDYGMGKTLYLWSIYKRLKTGKEFIRLSDNLVNILRLKTPVRNRTMIIDNFDLTEGLGDKQVYDLSEELLKLINGGTVVIIAARRDIIRRIMQANPLLRPLVNKIKIPGLTFEEAKSLVIRRLNEERSAPSKSIKPFTENELEEIWRKSHGNPRTILMLCKYLYDQRMLLEV